MVFIGFAGAERDNCTHGDIRIASQSDDTTLLTSEGRLELCVNSVWGTVCDSIFGSRDAHVACRQLGYAGEGMITGIICNNKWGLTQCIYLHSSLYSIP